MASQNIEIESLAPPIHPQPAVNDPLSEHIIPSAAPSILDQDPLNPQPLAAPLVKKSSYIEPPMSVIPRVAYTPAPVTPTPAPAACPSLIVKLKTTKAMQAVLASIQTRRKRSTRAAAAKVVKSPAPKPTPKKQVKQSGVGVAHRIPKWGTMFPKTGQAPSGEKMKKGSLEGHYAKEKCRGSPPVGVELQAWYNKFRSVESVLMKQLVKVYKDGKKAKKMLDAMRDSGWVRDKALDDLKARSAEEKKALKQMKFVAEDLEQWDS